MQIEVPISLIIEKGYPSYKSQPKVFKRFLNTFGIFEIWSNLMIFFFKNFKFNIVTYGEIKKPNYLENERS